MLGSPASLVPVTSTRQISHSLSHVRLTTSLTVTGHPTLPETHAPPTEHSGRPPARGAHSPCRHGPLEPVCITSLQDWCFPGGLHCLPRHTHSNRTSVALKSDRQQVCDRIFLSHWSTPGIVGSVRLLARSTANNKLPYWAIDPLVCVIVPCPARLHRGPQYLHALPCRIDRCLPTARVHTYDILHDHSFHPVTQSASPPSAVDDSFLRLACPVVPHAWPVVCDMHWRGTGQKERPANIKVWSTAGPP